MKILYRFSLMLVFAGILFGYQVLQAQQINTGLAPQTKLSVLQSDAQGLSLLNEIAVIKLQHVYQEDAGYSRLLVPGYVNNLRFGTPEVPVRRQLIEIPFGASVSVKVLDYTVKEYALNELGFIDQLYPSQPPRSKSQDEFVLVKDAKAYAQNGYIESELVSVDLLGMMRSTNIARVNVSPVQYNPATNTIRVYENLQFRLDYAHADQSKTAALKKALYSPYFNAVSRPLMNRLNPTERENFTRYPVSYVLISDRMFEAQLQDFIAWKTKKGFKIIEAYTDMPEVGNTTASIKTYLQGLYDAGDETNPAPSFVLFVGDIEQVPTWNNGNGVTDRNYVEYTGDLFPEIFYGRFSAQNTAQLQSIIDKTLQYEAFTMPDPSYLNEVVLVAGMDGSFGANWGNGQLNYGAINYFNEEHGITAWEYPYPGSGAAAAEIRQRVSDGVTFSNYSAHCSPDGWGDPSFSISHIPALQNQDKYGFMLSNCCSSSEYQLTECFAEAIVRAVGKGVVGHAGGSNSTYWDEDYYFAVGVGAITEIPPSFEETSAGAFDGLFHTHGEAFTEWYTTQDQVIFAGNLAVTEGSPGSAPYYWDIYNLIGDPSLMVYFSVPPVMEVSHTPFLPLGAPSIDVNAVPYAYVGFSIDGVLYGAGIADENGLATVQLDPIASPGIADLVVTAQNYQPYTGTVIVNAPDGPYVIYNSNQINDEDGNGQADYGENIVMGMTLENVGNGDANNVTATLTSDSPYVTITDDNNGFGNIAGGELSNVEDAFAFGVHNNVPDKQSIKFNVVAQSEGKDLWSSFFTIQAHAPAMGIASVEVDDEGGNGKLDPGENANLNITMENTGSADLLQMVSALVSTNADVVVNTDPMATEIFESGNTITLQFAITVSGEIADGSTVIFEMHTIGNHEFSATNTFNLTVGQIPVLILNLANGPSQASMESCLNTLNVGSEAISAIPTELNLYKSVFVCLGIYPDNHVLTPAEGQKLADYLDQGGRVYMEGGDTWAYDAVTPVHPYFNISGVADGSGDLNTLMGSDGSIAQGMQFVYNGRNSYIDQVNASGNGVMMFRNNTPDYGAAVSTLTDTYRAIGASFEFAGLEDEGGNTKDELMARFLSFFQIPFVWTGDQELATSDGADMQLYPNPASGQVNISFNLDKAARVSLNVYNTVGQKVGSFASHISATEGVQRQGFDASWLGEGIWFVALESDNFRLVKRLVIVK